METIETNGFVSRARAAIRNINSNELIELQEVFLSSVYASFFLFKPLAGGTLDAAGFMQEFLKSQLREPLFSDDPAIFDVSQRVQIENLDIGDTVLFPFVEITYNPYLSGNHRTRCSGVSAVLSQFETVFHRHVCVMEMSGYIVVFTDIAEDFFDLSTQRLLDLGYRKIELHNIIPKIIGSLSDELETGEAQISQLGVSFPLSMLGPHASIVDKIKDKAKIGGDENFKRVIRYGLLDSVQINSKFKIAFNGENEKDKYMLPGYIYSSGTINEPLLRNLKAFLDEIDSSGDENADNGGFAGLPIYVISGKRAYRNETEYPKFRFSGTGGNYEIRLNFDVANSDYIGDSSISGDFLITGIYPQYLKVWRSLEKKADIYCHLHEKEVHEDWSLNEESLWQLFKGRDNVPCDVFLNGIREKMAGIYQYVSEEIEVHTGHGHPNLMSSDFFMTARLDSNPNADYLINITNPKNGVSPNQKETLGKKISVELYRLASFDFRFASIESAINKYLKNGVKKFHLGNMEIYSKSINDGPRRILLNDKTFSLIKTKCTPAKNGNSGKKIDRYKKPDQYSGISYISDDLPFEDLISLSLIDLLAKSSQFDSVFFGGKGPGSTSRELADIVGIKRISDEKGGAVEVSLFHMKTDPFVQKSTSSVDSSFSLYTTVVGQVLEKMKPFLYAERQEMFLSELEKYFLSRDGEMRNGNYEIFSCIKQAVLSSKTKNLSIKVYFPIRASDYFSLDKADANNLKRLALETNWKRLRMISEIFEANASNANPALNLVASLGLVVCENATASRIDGHSKIDIQLIKDVSVLWK